MLALDFMVVRIVGLCLLLSPIARTMAAFHILLSLPLLSITEVSIDIRALPWLRQLSSFLCVPAAIHVVSASSLIVTFAAQAGARDISRSSRKTGTLLAIAHQ